MKTQRLLPALFLLTLLTAAYPQQKGVAEGRLVNGTDASIVARGVELEVMELGGGMSIIRTADTDSSGSFRFEGLPENQQLVIRANYKGANYHGQVKFDASGKAHVEIEVFEPTTSMKEIPIEGIQMAFQMAGDQLVSLETVAFDNKTKPPKTYVNPEGSFRISKPTGILEPPQMSIASPGSSMPLIQSALESPDGQSYYSLFPLRPGVTTFETQLLLPYANKSYTYTQKFFHDSGPITIGVTPQDMVVSGNGLSKIQTDSQKNIAVYRSAPIKAGTEVVWTFSGGTPVAQAESSEAAGDFTVTAMPNSVGRNALLIGPLLLMGFILVLWYAFNHAATGSSKGADFRVRRLKERREQLLNSMANLDHQYETHSLGKPEFLKQREDGKRQLRRIFLLLKKQ
jgi:hypothetical protein